MAGYVFAIDLGYGRNGTSLTLKCKDLLEYMAQSTVLPNMGFGDGLNFHFEATDTLIKL